MYDRLASVIQSRFNILFNILREREMNFNFANLRFIQFFTRARTKGGGVTFGDDITIIFLFKSTMIRTTLIKC